MSDARKRGMEYAMTVGSITGSMFTREELAVAWCAGEERGRNDALDAVMEMLRKAHKNFGDEGLPFGVLMELTEQLKKGSE